MQYFKGSSKYLNKSIYFPIFFISATKSKIIARNSAVILKITLDT